MAILWWITPICVTYIYAINKCSEYKFYYFEWMSHNYSFESIQTFRLNGLNINKAQNGNFAKLIS